jgi:hypothetical protein
MVLKIKEVTERNPAPQRVGINPPMSEPTKAAI